MRFLTVTLNPAIDLVGTCQNLKLGQVNRVQTLSQHPAGKGINVALILKSLGQKVTATGFLGTEHAFLFENFLAEKGIDSTFIIVNGKVRTNVKITAEQQSSDFNFSGFDISEQDWLHFVAQSKNWHKDFDFIVISGSLPLGITAEMFAQWCKILTEQGVKWCLDTSGEALKNGISAKPFLIKPNHEELLALNPNLSIEDRQAQLDFCQQLCRNGIANILFSAGAEGAYLIQPHQKLKAVSPCDEIVSTTGAGDSLLAAYLAHLTRCNEPLALQQATAIASLVVEQAGVHWDNNKQHTRLQQTQFSIL